MHVISLAGEYSPVMHLLVVSSLCIRPGSAPQPSRICVSSVAKEYSSATSIAYVSRMSGQGVLPSHVHLDRWFVCRAGEYSPAG